MAKKKQEMTLFDEGGELDLVPADETIGKTKVFEGAKYDRLSLKNNTFGIKMRTGETELPPEESSGVLDMVVLHSADDVHRLFWDGPYDANSSSAPKCYSSNGRVPDESVQEPEHDTCAFCPNNKDNSGENGIGKACKFSMPTVVAFVDKEEQELTVDVPVQFPVNGTSVFGDSDSDNKRFSLKDYTKELAARAKGSKMQQFITRVTFDRKSDTPCKVHFTAIGVVSRELNDAIKAMIIDGDYDLDDMVAMGQSVDNDDTSPPPESQPISPPAAKKKKAAKKAAKKKAAPEPEPEEEDEIEVEVEDGNESTNTDDAADSLEDMDFDVD